MYGRVTKHIARSHLQDLSRRSELHLATMGKVHGSLARAGSKRRDNDQTQGLGSDLLNAAMWRFMMCTNIEPLESIVLVRSSSPR